MNKVNILVIGSGGREHALIWKISQSPMVGNLYCSPSNGGIKREAKSVTLNGTKEIIEFCRENNIDLIVIGPEQPLVEGLTDILQQEGFKVFGPSKQAARLEGSKSFTKELCRKYNIPTAKYQDFTDKETAIQYCKEQNTPIVIKADGLAAGKGVIIAETHQEAEVAIKDILGGKFGKAGEKIIIEEFLQGVEVSFFVISDGENILEFSNAGDHKRAFDGDKGLNTGGMGSYSPSPFFNDDIKYQTLSKIIKPTIHAMKELSCDYRGVLFAGLMITDNSPKLIEFNCRFGDPEIQSIIMRLKSDIIPILLAAANGDLSGVKAEFSDEKSVCVVMATKGYPASYDKGSIIGNIEKINESKNSKIFHAGTKFENGEYTANGGRVLGVTAIGKDFTKSIDNAYRIVDLVDWSEGFYRKDIGLKISKEKISD